MASPGAGELTIVLVSLGELSEGGEFTPALLAELERRKLEVIQTTVADAEDEVAKHNPHLVVLCGTRGAQVIATLLDDGLQGTRPRLVITAPRAELAGLQGLNRNVVAGLLASDLGERLVVERLQTLARQAAQLRLGGFRTPSAPRVEILSMAPSVPEFFAGVESDIFDPIFPSAAPQRRPPAVGSGETETGSGEAATTSKPAAPEAPAPEATKAPEPAANGPAANEPAANEPAPPAKEPAAPATAPQVSRFQTPRAHAPKPQPLASRGPQRETPRPTGVAPKVEPPKTQAPKVEPPKIQAAKLGAPKAELPAKAEPVKGRPASSGAAQPASPKVEAPPPTPTPEEPTSAVAATAGAAPEPAPQSITPDSQPMQVAEGELQAEDIEDLTALADSAAPSMPAEAPTPTPPPLPTTPSGALPPVAPHPLVAVADPAESLPDATTDEAAAPEEVPANVVAAADDAPRAKELDPAPEVRAEPAPPAPEHAVPEQPSSRGAGRALAVATLLAAAGLGAYFALPTKETPQVQGVAPAQENTPEVAAAQQGEEATAPGTPAAPGTPPSTGEAAPSESPEAAPQEADDPLLVREAEVAGCAPLLEGFTPRMVDPVQEASLAWKEAREQIVKGDLQAVERKMCEAVQLHPQSAALEGLAMLYLTQHAPRRAFGYLEKAEAVRPGETETINLRGDIHSQLGEGDQALAAWLSALKLDASDTARRRMAAVDYANQGQGHFRRGALPQAERWFRRAAALDPTNVVALVGLGEVFLKTQRPESAEALARRALAVSELHPQAHVVVGDVARARGDTAAARTSYERALSVRSDHWPAKARIRELNASP